MEYSQIYVDRIRSLCQQREFAINKLAIAFNMTLAEFLDFEELNAHSFENDEE